MNEYEKYPTHENYQELYQRYFKRDVSELVNLANLKKKDRILDICCGGGRLSIEAYNHGAYVDALDKEINMIPTRLFQELFINYIVSDIKNALSKNLFNNDTYNAIFCQQAINYWFNSVEMKDICALIKDKGVFIFNTFNKKPPERPMIKEYQINGKDYTEISFLIENRIHHLQLINGQTLHETSFDWITPEEYMEKLQECFTVDLITDKSTSIYVCHKKN